MATQTQRWQWPEHSFASDSRTSSEPTSLQTMSSDQQSILLWFVTAILNEVVSSLALRLWLRRHDVRIAFGLAGIPGVMEYAYYQWCKTHGNIGGLKLVLFRSASAANVVAAAIFAIPLLANR